jgi:hypothetical protein
MPGFIYVDYVAMVVVGMGAVAITYNAGLQPRAPPSHGSKAVIVYYVISISFDHSNFGPAVQITFDIQTRVPYLDRETES